MLRILSLDGGGIRGIVTGQILVHLEKILQRESGNANARIADYFDLVSGTSTGGILAAALLIPDVVGNKRPKYSATDVAKIFQERGADIFDIPLGHRIRSAGGLLDEMYPAEGLEEALLDYFGEVWLSELIRPCLIPAYDIKRRKAHFFRQHEAFSPGDDFLVRDLSRATASAPTFFECSYITSRSEIHYPLIDGSIYANNPALCACAEGFSRFEKADDSGKITSADMLLLSLGTGHSRKLYNYDNAKDWGLPEWARPLFNMAMSSQTETTDYQTARLFEAAGNASGYLRIDPAIPDDISPEIDNASKENINDLRELGAYTAQQNDAVLTEFARKLLSTPPVRLI